ncbi:MAG: FeoB small GTPase domain-containing protein, partial [Cyanobacteriota bacterium]
MKTFLLIGFPNSGKSTIFNLLSGKSRKVSNYSGITVDSGAAELTSNDINEEKIRIIDLPGVYNLLPSSLDEGITVSTILNLNNAISEFHEIILVLDSSRFEASLALALSIKELVGNNISLLINKSDLFYKKNSIDIKKLEILLELPILLCSALKDDKTTSNEIDIFLRNKKSDNPIKVNSKIILTEKAASYLMVKDNYNHINITDNEEDILKKIQNFQIESRKIIKDATLDLNLKTIQSTYKIDKILLHPFWGGICFVAIFFLLFQSLYTVSAPIMTLIEDMVKISGDYVGSFLPDGLFKSLVVDGVFAGVGGVLVFLPQVGILFFLLSIMEQSGYISRA